MNRARPSWILICVLATAGCANQICPDHPPQQYQLAPNGRAVAYVDPQVFANILNWLENADPEPDTSFDCLIDRFTERFNNDVDIIFLMMNQSREEFLERSTRKVISNFTASQRIFERGIGTLPRSLISAVGPPSMRSYSFFSVREGLTAGPSLHEIAHGWCAYLDGPASLAGQIGHQPSNHWGFTSVGGVLGGWDSTELQALGGEKFGAPGPSEFEHFAPQGYANNNIPYAPLELYLMGLLGPEDVPDTVVAVNPVMAGEGGSNATFFADGLENVTIEDIIAANGSRVPDVNASQRHFNLALILISQAQVTVEQWQFYEHAMECMESTTSCGEEVTGVGTAGREARFVPLNFFEATGGRASLRFATLQEIAEPNQTTALNEPQAFPVRRDADHPFRATCTQSVDPRGL